MKEFEVKFVRTTCCIASNKKQTKTYREYLFAESVVAIKKYVKEFMTENSGIHSYRIKQMT